MIGSNRNQKALYLLVFLLFQLTDCRASPCPSSWISWEENCYRLEADKKARWDDAEYICQKMGSAEQRSHLASIHSVEEQDFIYELFKLAVRKENQTSWEPMLYIGLYVHSSPKDLSWSDGTHVNYTNWFPGRPDQYPNTVAELSDGYDKHGTWSNPLDVDTKENHYICKMPKETF